MTFIFECRQLSDRLKRHNDGRNKTEAKKFDFVAFNFIN